MITTRDGQDEAGKIFVGGIARDVDEGILTSYFSQFGNVCLATVMRDKFGISRGFGFVAFDPPEVARDVLKKVHTIEGRTIEIKQAVKHERVLGSSGTRGTGPVATVEKDGSIFVARQIYVGGLPYHITEREVREYFEQFGPVVSANLKYDFSQNPPKFRGFGFVNFVEDDSVEKALENYSSHQLSGKWIEVKRSKHSHVVQGENSGVIMPQMAQGAASGRGGAYEGARAPAYQDPYGGAASRDPYGGSFSREPNNVAQTSGPVRGTGYRGSQGVGSYRSSPYGMAPPSSHPREAVSSYRDNSAEAMVPRESSTARYSWRAGRDLEGPLSRRESNDRFSRSSAPEPMLGDDGHRQSYGSGQNYEAPVYRDPYGGRSTYQPTMPPASSQNLGSYRSYQYGLGSQISHPREAVSSYRDTPQR
jgi:RNA recognition motif-containing protein